MLTLFRRANLISLVTLALGIQNLCAEEASSPAARYLNSAYSLNLQSVSLDEASVPAGSFLSAFSGSDSQRKNYFFTQVSENKKPHGAFLLTSDDGSVLAAGRFEKGRMGLVRVFKDENEVMFEKTFVGDLEPNFGEVYGTPLPSLEGDIDIEKAASYRNLLRGILEEPVSAPASGDQVASPKVEVTGSEGKDLLSLLKIKAANYRKNAGIATKEDGVAIESSPTITKEVPPPLAVSTPSPDAAVSEIARSDKYFAQVSSDLLSDLNVQKLGTQNGLADPRNPEAVDAAEVIEVGAGDFRNTKTP